MSNSKEISYEAKLNFCKDLRLFINKESSDIDNRILNGAALLKINDWLKVEEFEKTRKFTEILKDLEFYELRSLYYRAFTSIKRLYEKDKVKYSDFEKVMNEEDDLAYLCDNSTIDLTVFLFIVKRQASLTRMIVESLIEGR